MSLEKARKNYQLWHTREPDAVASRQSKGLDAKAFCKIGRAVNILYESDKWEQKGKKRHLYDHDFDSHPAVYAPCRCAPGSCSSVTRSRLLGSGHPAGKAVLTELGTVETFTVETLEGETDHFEFSRKVYLYSTPDLRAIVMPFGSDVFVVRGGEMKVTARGIVK